MMDKDKDKYNSNLGTMGPRDPKEATILTQIDEERTEGTLEQKKLMSMFNGELNDLKLPEYQGI